MEILSEDESWDLFQKHAFSSDLEDVPSQLMELGREISKQCEMHPLSIRTTASSLRGITSTKEWYTRLEALRSLDKASEEYKPSEKVIKRLETLTSFFKDCYKDKASEKCLKRLRYCYENLPSYLKPCFVYFGMFRDVTQMDCRDHIWRWISEDLVGKEYGRDPFYNGEMYLNMLRQYCFIEIYEDKGLVSRCRMDPLLHNLAYRIFKENKGRVVSTSNPEAFQKGDECVRMKIFLQKGVDGKALPSLPASLRSIEMDATQLDYEAKFKVRKKVFANTKELAVLRLRGWQFYAWCEAFNGFKFLQCLDIARTDINGVPEGIRKLKLLRTLCVGQISEWPSWIGELQFLQQLEHFKSYNHAVRGPRGMRGLTQLLRVCGQLEVEISQGRDENSMTVDDLWALQSLVELHLRFPMNNSEPLKLPFLPNLARLLLAGLNNVSESEMKDVNTSFNVLELFLTDMQVPQWIQRFTILQRLTFDIHSEVEFQLESNGVESLPFLRYLDIHVFAKKLFTMPREWGQPGAFPALEVLKVHKFEIEEGFQFDGDCMSKLKSLHLYQVLIRGAVVFPIRIFQTMTYEYCDGIQHLDLA